MRVVIVKITTESRTLFSCLSLLTRVISGGEVGNSFPSIMTHRISTPTMVACSSGSRAHCKEKRLTLSECSRPASGSTASPAASSCSSRSSSWRAAAAAASCSRSRSIPTRRSSPSDSRELTNHERAVQGISPPSSSKDLKLPMPERVTVYVYSSRQVFEQGLIRDAQRVAGARGRAERLRDRRRPPPPAPLQRRGVRSPRPRVAAAHRARARARRRRSSSPRARAAPSSGSPKAWRSGSRSTCSSGSGSTPCRTAAASPPPAFARTRRSWPRSSTSTRSARPAGFTVRHLKEGSLPTYQLAFLMADYLITRDGFDRTVAVLQGLRPGRRPARDVPHRLPPDPRAVRGRGARRT